MTEATVHTTIAATMLFGALSALSLAAVAADTNQPQATAGYTQVAAAQSTKTMSKHHQARESGEVRAAQEALNKQGADVKVDGVVGPKARLALKTFQTAHGLRATAKLNEATGKALKGA